MSSSSRSCSTLVAFWLSTRNSVFRLGASEEEMRMKHVRLSSLTCLRIRYRMESFDAPPRLPSNTPVCICPGSEARLSMNPVN